MFESRYFAIAYMLCFNELISKYSISYFTGFSVFVVRAIET